jgi:integrase
MSMIPTAPESRVPVKLPPHVKLVRNRVGREYYYLTLNRGTHLQGKPVRLPDDPRTPDFWNAYAQALGLPPARENSRSVAALDRAWGGDPANGYAGACPEWAALSPGTQREWMRHRRRIVEAWGALEVAGLSPKHVLELRDAWADVPATANNMLRCLSSMLGWSVPRDWRADNPCREVRPLKGGPGYAPWSWDVITAAERELVAKGRQDLWWAVALALYTGQRLGDCLAMKWSALSDLGVIAVTQGKTGKDLLIPAHERLAALLATIPRRAVTILTSTEGTPWQGFQTAWRKHRPRAVVEQGLVFHGLRKSAVVTLLEAGCTEAETAAVTGQSAAMVAHYAKGVNQQKLAASAILKWERAGALDGTGTERTLGTRLGTRPLKNG